MGFMGRMLLRLSPIGVAGATVASLAIVPMFTILLGCLVSVAGAFGFIAWRAFRR